MKIKASPRSLLLAGVLSLSLGLLGLQGCDRADPDTSASGQPGTPPASSSSPLHERLEIITLGTRPLAETLRVAGRIEFDQQHLARIGASVTGRITRLLVTPGQSVQRGEVLAEVHSAELGTAQLNFIKTQAHATFLQRQGERAQMLYDSDVIGAAELQRRQSEAAIAAAESRAASDQLRVLGMSAAAIAELAANGRIDSITTVTATISGTVVDSKVSQGQVVQPAEALFTVAELSQVWVTAQVPEQQAGIVHPGKTVTVEIPALNNETRHGTLIHVAETVAPDTRTVLVRTELPNPDRRLKPAMLATMLITGKPQERLVVPAVAVVREGEREAVYVLAGTGQYRLTPVRLGPLVDGHHAVLSGLRAGERIVAEGAFHLHNETRRQAEEGAGS